MARSQSAEILIKKEGGGFKYITKNLSNYQICSECNKCFDDTDCGKHPDRVDVLLNL